MGWVKMYLKDVSRSEVHACSAANVEGERAHEEIDAAVLCSNPHPTGRSSEPGGIEKLIVCGVQSDFCVDSTVRRALALGYPIVLLADAHSTIDNSVFSAARISEHHNQTLANLGSYGPRVTLVNAADFDTESSWH
jgi:hypothetical protein